MIIGILLGLLNKQWINELGDFIAIVYTRLFQFIAVPTIALAICTTLISLGGKKDTGKIFLHTVFYTLLTTFISALVGLALFKLIAPGNLPAAMLTPQVQSADRQRDLLQPRPVHHSQQRRQALPFRQRSGHPVHCGGRRAVPGFHG